MLVGQAVADALHSVASHMVQCSSGVAPNKLQREQYSFPVCHLTCPTAQTAELGPEAIRAILLRYPTPLDLYQVYQVRPVCSSGSGDWRAGLYRQSSISQSL